MGVKHTVKAECDAIKCVYEATDGRSIEDNDGVYITDDTIFHARCFNEMSPMDVAVAFRIPIKGGDFRTADVDAGADGLPDLSRYVVQQRTPVG